MPFCRPNIECLLRQIASVGFRLSQTERKLIQRPVILLNQTLEIRALSALFGVTHEEANCSRRRLKSPYPLSGVRPSSGVATPGKSDASDTHPGILTKHTTLRP